MNSFLWPASAGELASLVVSSEMPCCASLLRFLIVSLAIDPRRNSSGS